MQGRLMIRINKNFFHKLDAEYFSLRHLFEKEGDISRENQFFFWRGRGGGSLMTRMNIFFFLMGNEVQNSVQVFFF